MERKGENRVFFSLKIKTQNIADNLELTYVGIYQYVNVCACT